MTQKVKENGELIWKTIAMGLLSVCLYFLIKIDNKVELSYKSAIEQPIINQGLADRIHSLEDLSDRIGINVAELSARTYKLESKKCNQ